MTEAATPSLVTVGGKIPKKRISAAARRKRRRTQKMIAGGVFALLILLIWFGVQPLRGNMDYGICRTFAELQSSNPDTMKIISYENYGAAWKIFYSFIGQYGEQRSNFIDCVFTNDANGQRIIREVKINRVPLDKVIVDRFNMSIPGVIAAGPNLVIPPKLEESNLRGLRSEAGFLQ